MIRAWAVVSVVLVLVTVSCAPATRQAAPATSGERWIAVQMPSDSDDGTPPIQKVKALDVFASESDCEAYRMALAREAGEVSSANMSGQGSAVRCVRAARPSPRPATTR
jgi:hypothetical protein